MIKRIPLLIAVAAVGLSANAKQISVQQAEVVARKYVAVPTLQKKMLGLGQQATAPYYAFNSDKGFVVVSGDDSLTELVCYSDHGTIDTDNLPAPLKELLDGYATYVKAVQNGTAKAVRTETSSDPTIIVSPMVTTKWDQDEPYNNMVPKDCATGCAATALAQVMNYHEWPVTGTGSVTYTDATYGTMTMDFSKSTYDWANMLDEYHEDEYTDAQANAVAKLMLDCGMALNMQYGPSSSASAIAYRKCAEYFKYDVDIILREDRSTADNIKLVTDELKSGRPFIIGAQSLEGGHAFVADGYDSNNFLHINWGWGGLSDAYFNLNYLDPDSQGIGGGEGAYSWDQIIIFFKPLRDGETAEGRTSLGYVTELEGHGVKCKSASFAKTETAPFTISKIYNTGTLDFVGNVAMGIFDSNNTLAVRSLATVDFTEDQPLKAEYYSSSTFDLPVDLSTLADGTYTARGIYRVAENSGDETKWERFESTSVLSVTVNGNNVTVAEPAAALATTKAATVSGNRGLGHIVSFNASLVNNSPITADGFIKYHVAKKSDGSTVSSGKVAAIIYDYSDYATKIPVYLSANRFEQGETYVFTIDGVADEKGNAFNFTNNYGDIEFTTTTDEPLLQKQLTLYNATSAGQTYEAQVAFSSDKFSKKDGTKALVIGPIANLNSETFVGKIGYIINKLNGETIYSVPAISTGSTGLPSKRAVGYQTFSIANTPIASISENGVYSLLAATVEVIDGAYPDEMVTFSNAEDYRLDFRVNGNTVTRLYPEKKIEQTAAVTATGSKAIDEQITFNCQLENKNSADASGYVKMDIMDSEGVVVDELTSSAATIPAYNAVNVQITGTLLASNYTPGATYTARVTEFTNDDDYSFSVSADYDCEFTIDMSGVETVANAAVKVYPNPAVDAIHTTAVAERIAVYSISGALVAEAANTNSLSVANLSSGCYIVAVTANGSTTRSQIVKK